MRLGSNEERDLSAADGRMVVVIIRCFEYVISLILQLSSGIGASAPFGQTKAFKHQNVNSLNILWTLVWLDSKLCFFYPWEGLKNISAAYVGGNEAPEINDRGGLRTQFSCKMQPMLISLYKIGSPCEPASLHGAKAAFPHATKEYFRATAVPFSGCWGKRVPAVRVRRDAQGFFPAEFHWEGLEGGVLASL